jgi:hypothetical protein
MARAGSAVVSLSLQAEEETRFLWSMAVPSLEVALPQPEDAGPASLREVGKGLSLGLEPVADHARRALDLFLREVPPLPAGNKTS